MAVNDGAAAERSYMEVSTRYANGFLNEYGQDLHNEEKTEYDFASELKNKMQEHSESKKEKVDSRELWDFYSLEVSDSECQQGR